MRAVRNALPRFSLIDINKNEMILLSSNTVIIRGYNYTYPCLWLVSEFAPRFSKKSEFEKTDMLMLFSIKNQPWSPKFGLVGGLRRRVFSKNVPKLIARVKSRIMKIFEKFLYHRIQHKIFYSQSHFYFEILCR